MPSIFEPIAIAAPKSISFIFPLLQIKILSADAFALANANVSDIERYIKRIGLYRSKARNIHALAESLVEQFDGQVPIGMKDLTSLAGVGRKTANVVRSVAFDIPAFAVDTHVARISKRLGLAKVQDDVETVESKCKRKIKRERWNRVIPVYANQYFDFYNAKLKGFNTGPMASWSEIVCDLSWEE